MGPLESSKKNLFLCARLCATYYLLSLLGRENGLPCLDIKSHVYIPWRTHLNYYFSARAELATCASHAGSFPKRNQFLLTDMYTHQAHVFLMTLAQKRGHQQRCKWNLKTLLHIFTKAARPAIWEHPTLRVPFLKKIKLTLRSKL